MAAKGQSALSKLPLAAKVGIGVAMAALVVVAYFIIFYSDVSGAIRAERAKETDLRSKLADQRKIEFAYHQDLAELNERTQRQRELSKVLPESASYPAFLSALQGVANVSGVTLQGWSPMEESPQQFYAKVPMRLRLTGRFHQIAKFFAGVGQLDRIINIEEIKLSEPKMEGEDVVVKAECLATAFRSLPAGAAPPPKAGGNK
jgi:type IV pilus assembly protein PilO